MLPVILALVAVIAVVVIVMRLRGAHAKTLEERLDELAAMGQTMTLEELELSQPFTQRVIIPMLESIAKTAQKFTPASMMNEMTHKLELAGMTSKVKPVQFLGIRIGATVLGGILGVLLALTGKTLPGIQRFGLSVAGFGLGFYFPMMWLNQKIKKRQEEVTKALPDALDLLTICVEAGLGFDAAMSKVAEKWDNELSRAFAKTVQEMQLGKIRREALRNLANSLEVPDVTSFAAAIIQADQLGVSMAKVMRIQSEQMREKRRQRAEEKARQAPVKIMIPTIFLIFPSLLIVLLGPAIIQVKQVFAGGGGPF